MKRSNLIVSLAYMLLGIIFLGGALLVGSDLKGLFFGFAGAGIGPGAVGVYRYWHWSAPPKCCTVCGDGGSQEN